MKIRILTLILSILSFSSFYSGAQIKRGEPHVVLRPELENSGSFSMIMIPDPQSQNKFASNQPLFSLITSWVVQNKENLNIKSALITGDFVEQNNHLLAAAKPNPDNGDQTSRQQWEAASKSLSILDGKLPYIVTQGNHDVGYLHAETRFSELPKYIYPERNEKILDHLCATGLNAEGKNTLENAAYVFHTDTWKNLMIVSLEFDPRDEAIDWAKALINEEKYKNYTVILLVHSFLTTDGKHYESDKYTLSPKNCSAQLWEKLVYPSSNIKLVLCGHAGEPVKIKGDEESINDIDYRTTCAYREDKAKDGHRVPQMMFNSQSADGSWFGNGGDCWLRILEFKPDGRTIGVRTFSPLFALSKITSRFAERTNSYDKFNIVLD